MKTEMCLETPAEWYRLIWTQTPPNLDYIDNLTYVLITMNFSSIFGNTVYSYYLVWLYSTIEQRM